MLVKLPSINISSLIRMNISTLIRMNISTLIRMNRIWLLLLLLCLSFHLSHQCKSSPAKSNPTAAESTIKGIIKFRQAKKKDTQNFRTILRVVRLKQDTESG